MNQNRGMIAGACVACLGIGYFTGSNPDFTTKSDGIGEHAQNLGRPWSSYRDRMARGSSPSDDLLSEILNGRSLQDLSDSDQVEIVIRLCKADSNQDPIYLARKSYQLQLLLAKLPNSRLEEAAEAILSDPPSIRLGSLGNVISALTSKDPDRALAWAQEQKKEGIILANVIGSMAKEDPFKAAEIYRSRVLDGTLDPEAWTALSGVGTAMARLGKKPLLDFIDGLPLRLQGNVLSNAFRDLPEKEKSEVIDEAYSRYKDGNIRDWFVKSIFSDAFAYDPERADAWLAKMPRGKESASLALSTAGYLSQTNPEASREWMSRAISQSQGSEKDLLLEAIQNSFSPNSADIITLASLLPEKVEFHSEDLKDSVSKTIAYNLNGLPEIVGVLHDPAEQAELITNALDQIAMRAGSNSPYGKMNPTDFAILEGKLRKLGLSGENAEKVQSSLDRARNARLK